MPSSHQEAEEQNRQREDRAPTSPRTEETERRQSTSIEPSTSTEMAENQPQVQTFDRQTWPTKKKKKKKGRKKKKKTRSVPVEIAEAERTGAEQRERTDEEEEGKLLKLGFSGVRKQATEASSSKHLFDKEGKKEFLFFFQFFPQRIFKIHKALALLRLAPRAPRRKALASPRASPHPCRCNRLCA